MKLKCTFLFVAFTLFVGFVSAQEFFSTDGIYAIQNVGRGTFITPSSTTGFGVPMSTGTSNDFKWIIKANGSKYNIMTEDETILLKSTGTQGAYVENTEINRNDETKGALVTFEEISTGTRFKTPTGTAGEIVTWNGNRSTATFLGMGAQQNETAQWTLIRLGDLTTNSNANTWTGATSTAWDDAGNWSTGTVPTSGEAVAVADVTNRPVISGGVVEVASLELANSSILTVSSLATLTITGDLTVSGNGRLDIASGASLVTYGTVGGTEHIFHRSTTFDKVTAKFSAVGSPVVGASTSVLGQVYSYDETLPYSTYRYSYVETPEIMEGGDAYFSAFTGDVIFTGTPHTGDVTLALAYDAADAADAGFNLVSNPYPAAIDFSKFVNATTNPDIDGTIYLWDDGGSDIEQRTNADYITVNAIGVASAGSGRSADFNGHIGSAQGFFVKANKAAGSLNYNNAMKVTGNNGDANYFRKGSKEGDIQSLKVALTSVAGLKNESLIGFVADATVGFDRLYDAYKMDGLNGVKLYSLLNDNAMSIQGLPITDEMIIPMGIALDAAGKYTLSLEFTKNLGEGKVVYLEDTRLNKTINLSEVNNYTFESSATAGEVRFNLIVTNVAEVLSANDLVNTDLKVMYTRNNITITSQNLNLKEANVSILNLSGALLFSKTIEGLKGEASFDYQFQSKRVYIIKVTTEAGSDISKVVFN